MTCVAVSPRFDAVTSTVTSLFAIDALNLHTINCCLLFLAELCNMAELWRKVSSAKYVRHLGVVGFLIRLPLQLLHFGIPRSIGVPASFKRSRFSSGVAGHPSFRNERGGLSLKKYPTVYLQSCLPWKLTRVKVSVISFSYNVLHQFGCSFSAGYIGHTLAIRWTWNFI